MSFENKQLKLCNCNKTLSLDARALSRSLDLKSPVVIHTELCRKEVGAMEAALRGGAEVVVACTQEGALFDAVAQEVDLETSLSYVNIRETGGWSVEGGAATPKIAALLAAALGGTPRGTARCQRAAYRSRGWSGTAHAAALSDPFGESHPDQRLSG